MQIIKSFMPKEWSTQQEIVSVEKIADADNNLAEKQPDQEVIKVEFLDLLNYGDIQKILDFYNKLNENEKSFFHGDALISESLEKKLRKYIRYGTTNTNGPSNSIRKFQECFFPDESGNINDLIKKILDEDLSDDTIRYSGKNIVNNFPESLDYIKSDEYKEKFTKAIKSFVDKGEAHMVRHSIEGFNFIINEKELFELIKPAYISIIERGYSELDDWDRIFNENGLNLIYDEDCILAAKKGIVTAFNGNQDIVRGASNAINLANSFLSHKGNELDDKEIQDASIDFIKKALEAENLKGQYVEAAIEVKSKFLKNKLDLLLENQEIKSLIRSCLVSSLDGNITKAKQDENLMPNAILNSFYEGRLEDFFDQDILDKAAAYVRKNLKSNIGNCCEIVQKILKNNPEEIEKNDLNKEAVNVLLRSIVDYQGNSYDRDPEKVFTQLSEVFALPQEIGVYNFSGGIFKSIVEYCGVENINELIELVKENKDYIKYLKKNGEGWSLSLESLNSAKKMGIPPADAHVLVKIQCLFYEHLDDKDHVALQESFSDTKDILGLNNGGAFFDNLGRFKLAFDELTDSKKVHRGSNPHSFMENPLAYFKWNEDKAREEKEAMSEFNTFSSDPKNNKESQIDFNNLTEEGFKNIFLVLSRKNSLRKTEIKFDLDWQDIENVSGPFQAGAEIFGYKRMFSFINRQGLSRHDSLYAFHNIVELFNKSELSADAFFGSILSQVKLDGRTYEEGISYHCLNKIAQNIDTNFEETVEKLKGYENIPRLQSLARSFDSSKDIFSSWSNLRKFYEVQKLFKKSWILDQLSALKESGDENLYSYIETLAFHESSDIDMSKVVQFWNDPRRFLDQEDMGASHKYKKPSNYTKILNLDLSSQELRDSLVDGKLDSLQSFHPMEILYAIPKDGKNADTVNTRTFLQQALGSKRQSIPGKAINPGKLFSEVNKFFKSSNIDLIKYLGGEQELSSEKENELVKIIENPEIGFLENQGPVDRYRARVYLKSDPEGVVAGNDTACCMPFGSGKNNVYTFNPVCSIFAIQKENANGKWRTIAQSVLTEDIDIKASAGEALGKMSEAKMVSMQQVIPGDILVENVSIITADNVEVSPNFMRTPNSQNIIENIYHDFFKEYLQRFNDGDFDASKIIIGKGYSDALNGLPQIENRFIPRAPVAYSDNEHGSSYSLDITKDPKLKFAKSVKELSRPENKSENAELLAQGNIKGLEYLNFKDTLPASYIEGKAYADNPNLLAYIHKIENTLIAKDINNAAKDRPNMSLKWQDSQGVMHGYLLAYEGKSEDGVDIIHIADLATDKKTSMGGGSLIKGFCHLYQKNYLEKDTFTPVIFEVQDKSFYELIVKQLDRIADDLGIKIGMKEKTSIKDGKSVHSIILQPVNVKG